MSTDATPTPTPPPADTPPAPVSAAAAPPARKDSGFALILGGIAGAISIIAGIYLFQTESASEDATIFDALFKGLGGYMFARGLWMLSRLKN
jgi:hypothetical protein